MSHPVHGHVLHFHLLSSLPSPPTENCPSGNVVFSTVFAVPAKPKPKLPGLADMRGGTGAAKLAALLNKFDSQGEVAEQSKGVKIPIIVTKEESVCDINANNDKVKATGSVRDASAETGSAERAEDENNSTDENVTKFKEEILDTLDVDADLDICVPSDSEEPLKKAGSVDNIYEEIEYSDDEQQPVQKGKEAGSSKLTPPSSTKELTPADRDEEEKCRLKRKFTKKLPRKMSRKYSRRPGRIGRENIYSTIDDDEEEVLEFSDQDSDSTFEEDSLTDDSDVEFEEKMIKKLQMTGQVCEILTGQMCKTCIKITQIPELEYSSRSRCWPGLVSSEIT